MELRLAVVIMGEQDEFSYFQRMAAAVPNANDDNTIKTPSIRFHCHHCRRRRRSCCLHLFLHIDVIKSMENNKNN